MILDSCQWGKKDFFSVEVLHFTLLYLWPQGRSVLGVGWILGDGGSAPVDSTPAEEVRCSRGDVLMTNVIPEYYSKLQGLKYNRIYES